MLCFNIGGDYIQFLGTVSKPIRLQIERSKVPTPLAAEIYASSVYFQPYLRNWVHVGFSYASFEGDAKLSVLRESLKISLSAIGDFPGSIPVNQKKKKKRKKQHKFSNKHI